MPSLVIDDKQTEFSYLDSGRPERDIYTTVVVVHGHTFHSGVFQRIMPLASSEGLRLICLNRRDYAGTTLFNAAELKVLAEGTEAEKAAFLEARGIEISLFLDRLIDELSLPPPAANGHDGGLALMGWSLGNVEALAAFAAVSSLPKKVQDRLQVYLRRLVLLDPPTLALGIEDPPQKYFPLLDETLPEEQRGSAFAQWVSSYYSHGDLSAQNVDNLADKSPDASRPPSVANMTMAEFGSIMDIAPGPRSEIFLITKFEAALSQQTSRALFDRATRALWPQTAVWLAHGDASPWNVIYAAWEIESRAKTSGQPVQINLMKGVHHFGFWDEPEKSIGALAHCVHE